MSDSNERRSSNDDSTGIIIPQHFIPKLEMWSSKNRLGLVGEHYNLGEVAILTNHGVILENGGISFDGVHYDNDDKLPVYHPTYYNVTALNSNPHPHDTLYQFKMLFTDGEALQQLNFGNYFKNKFKSFLNESNIDNVMRDIENKLETSEGQQLIAQKNFKIYAIVNMRAKNRYRWSGIYITNKNQNAGRDGVVYLNKSSLVLVAGNIKVDLSK